MCVRVSVCVFARVFVCAFMCVSVCVCLRVCACVHAFVFVRVCEYVCDVGTRLHKSHETPGTTAEEGAPRRRAVAPILTRVGQTGSQLHLTAPAGEPSAATAPET